MSTISSSLLSSNKEDRDLHTRKFLPTKENLQKVLDILSTAEDHDLQVKTFSILSVYLITDNEYIDVIITSNIIYNKLYILLTRGQSTIKARILNFISAMLLTDEEVMFTRTKRLVIYAQNMIRHSGCLMAISDLFLSFMMSRETWKALCMCLAGVCQNCTDNQAYCSHLVPLCVQKCQQGDIEVMVTLNSLINNHSRNMKLFLECNGLSIFDKEILQHDSYMELLDVVVQTITLEMLVALYKTVIRQLRYIKAEFGLDSRVRQWATVILHHFNTRLKEFNINEYKNKIDLNETKAATQVIQRPNYDETKKLLQNVIKEIYQYNANCDEIIPLTNEKVSNVQNDNISNYDSRKGVINSCRNPREAISRNGTVKLVKEKSFENSMKELSFSFLSQSQWDTKYQNTNLSNCNNEQRPNQLVSNQNFKDNIAINNTKISSTNIPGQHSKYDKSDTIKCEPSTTNVFHFKPTFVSTPKHSKYRHENFSIKKPTQMSRINRSTFKKLSRQNFKTKRYQHNTTKETKEHDSMKNRSLSVRLFDVINDSCTTFVKTVTKIFRSKKVTNKQAAPTAATKIDPSCNNSFTDYMRRRDAALLEKQTTKSIDETNNINSCKTCNDTLLLKRKIMDDDYLKETVKKLKMGIYVYGCDFKKISRTIWPNESYMTPEMLYNLYRKVILK